MLDHRFPSCILQTLLLLCLLAGAVGMAATSIALTSSTAVAAEDNEDVIPNRRCLKCHNDPDDKTWELDDGTIVNIYIDADGFSHSVHGEQNCVGCHNSIKKAKHERPLPKSIGCVECHLTTWEAQQGEEDPEYQRLDVVVAQIESYMRSVHARPNLMDQSKTNATCYDCHEAHTIGTIGSAARADHRQRNPEVCGRCHQDEKQQYLKSVHGQRHQQQSEDANAAKPPAAADAAHAEVGLIGAAHADPSTVAGPAAEADDQHSPAVCSDCHTPHSIDSPEKDPIKLMITESCGSCHEKQVRTYEASYHGQVIRAGYTHTAKCYDCHGSHGVMDVDDPGSKVHPDNRLETCRKCHENAPAGFLGFHAHGDAEDFENYPEMWLTKRFMEFLIIGVFAFFWTHMLLWIYREWRDRKQKSRQTQIFTRLQSSQT